MINFYVLLSLFFHQAFFMFRILYSLYFMEFENQSFISTVIKL